MAEEQRGLVLVTGPTGSGRTTTTAAMISHIDATRRGHIVTLEDPVEVLHPDDHAIIDRREIGVTPTASPTDSRPSPARTPTSSSGVSFRRRLQTSASDVVFIGEMRDLETVEAALQAAETGHLAISSLHTTDARETVSRSVDLYPRENQGQARLSLANSLKGIVCQRLAPRTTGAGRIAVVEVLVMTTRTYEFVVDSVHRLTRRRCPRTAPLVREAGLLPSNLQGSRRVGS